MRQAPSLPFAFADWGAARLMHDDPDGALAVLRQGHEAGPRFADPLELMGEAQLRKGDYRAAVAQFRRADEAAPRWGRNHLRWGEALVRSGHEREGKAELEKARSLGLSATETAELGGLLGHAPTASPR